VSEASKTNVTTQEAGRAIEDLGIAVSEVIDNVISSIPSEYALPPSLIFSAITYGAAASVGGFYAAYEKANPDRPLVDEALLIELFEEVLKGGLNKSRLDDAGLTGGAK